MNSFKKFMGLLKQSSPAALQTMPSQKNRSDRDGATLIDFGHKDIWTIRDAFEGTQVFGATGSGKTSGSGQAIAEAFLKAGFGGLVLTAKPGELKDWRWYMDRVHKETGRNPDDLIEFSPSSGKQFNFLEYERQNGGEGAGLVDNLVSLFFAIMEVDERANDQIGGDPFWKRTSKQLLRNTIGILLLADKKLTIQNITSIISSSPKFPGQGDDPGWQGSSFLYECMFEASGKLDSDQSAKEDYELICRYWDKDFPELAPETRSSVIMTFSSMADSLMRAPLRELFSRDTNLTPEDTHKGKVILLNLPVETYNEVGTIAQVLFKYCWQRATQRRPAESQAPVFLWVDESQYFINSYDMLFQTTARSKRAATVYLSQNISNYYARLSGARGRPEADSLLGNFQTKIFHTNGDNVTNQWASETISKDWTTKTDTQTSISRNEAWGGKQPSSSSQFNVTRQKTIEFQVQPVEFTRLRKGGPTNNKEVEAIVFQAGRIFSHGKSFAKVTFKQKERP